MADTTNTTTTDTTTTTTTTDAPVAAPVKTRKSPDLKNKTVKFALKQELRLADLVKEGYQRREVEALFTKMQAEGLGVFHEGMLGRGKSAKFVCNDGFPTEYTIEIGVRRLRKTYTGKPVEIVAEVAPEAPAAEPTIIPAEQSWLCADAPQAEDAEVPAEQTQEVEQAVATE